MEAKENGTLPEAYHSHPIVIAHPNEAVIPWGLYMDSVAYSGVDSCLGVWLIDLLSGTRILLCLLRKLLSCQCGCRGWCTWYGLLAWLKWSFDCMGKKIWPESRHDRADWRWPQDEKRIHRAGTPLQHRGILLRLKGDWEEFCSRLGFPTWQSGSRPCFCCVAFGQSMFDVEGVSLASLTWRKTRDEDYSTACTRCEHWVQLEHEADRMELVRLLNYDRRQAGAHGRALTQDVPKFGLLAQDRLEPCPDLPDVGKLETVGLPTRICFWRSSSESACTHRCPLFSDELGITPSRTICIDLLHTLFLGPMLCWCKFVLWELLSANVWPCAQRTEAERIKVGMLLVVQELKAFYRSFDAAHPGHPASRIGRLTVKMVGTKDDRKLKLKAMETYGFLHYLVHKVRLCHERLGAMGPRVLESGEILIRYVEEVKVAPANIPLHQQQVGTDNFWIELKMLEKCRKHFFKPQFFSGHPTTQLSTLPQAQTT